MGEQGRPWRQPSSPTMEPRTYHGIEDNILPRNKEYTLEIGSRTMWACDRLRFRLAAWPGRWVQ